MKQQSGNTIPKQRPGPNPDELAKESLGKIKQKFIVMSGFTCPHCNERVNLFGSGGGERTAQTYGIKFLGKIPFDPNMVKCGDQGIAFQEKFKVSVITDAFKNITRKM